MSNDELCEMTDPEGLAELITDIFGEQRGAIKSAAHTVGINYDNLRKMLRGRIRVKRWVIDNLLAERERRAEPDVHSALNNLRDSARARGMTGEQFVCAVVRWADGQEEITDPISTKREVD